MFNEEISIIQDEINRRKNEKHDGSIVESYDEVVVQSVVNERQECTLFIQKEENIYQLNSMYSPDEFAEQWAKQFEFPNYRNIAVVFGLADGRYVRELRKKNEDMIIIVYEPCDKITEFLQENSLFDREAQNVLIIDGENRFTLFYEVMGILISDENKRLVKVCVSPNYDRLFASEIGKAVRLVNENLEMVQMNYNTYVLDGHEMLENLCNNIIDNVRQYSVSDLIEKFRELDKETTPAIIIAAGPSLDKNVKDLKMAKGKAFLIAVDTALNALAKADIIPDIAVTVDPHKPLSLFEHDKMRNVPLVFTPGGNCKIRTINHGMHFYEGSGNSLMQAFFKQYGKTSTQLESGGSVANNAYSLAQKMGFTTIIFVGQDLAYPNNQEHASDSYGSLNTNTITEDGRYFYVEDNFGGMVKTEPNMDMYRRWFEKVAAVYVDVRHINATEGGAKIHGMDFMPLRQALEETCKSEELIDFSAMVEAVPHAFSDEQQIQILKQIAEYDSTLKDIRKRFRDGLKLYEKLKKKNKKQSYVGEEFSKLIEQIGELNTWISNDKSVSYLTLYSAKENYAVKDVIYSETEDAYEELKLVTDNGICMLDSLIKSTEKVEEDMLPIMAEAKQILEEMGYAE